MFKWLLLGVGGYMLYNYLTSPAASGAGLVLRATKVAGTEVDAAKGQLAGALTNRGWTVGGLPLGPASVDIYLDSTSTQFTLAIGTLDVCTKPTIDALISCANSLDPMQL